jgi:2-oxoglutarate dehydrogenase E2 component (dihydrolipoamide succinyltransferase)
MSIEIRVPEMGESIIEATVGQWYKKEGESIAAGEPVLELETEKVNVEVNASQDGTLERVLKQEGENVTVGEVLGTITEGAASVQPAPESGTRDRGIGIGEETTSPQPPAPSPQPLAPSPQLTATPVARKMAERFGIDISQIKGTGRGERITQEDVEEYVSSMMSRQAVATPRAPEAPRPEPPSEARSQDTGVREPLSPQPPAPSPLGRYEERVRLSRRRLTIARRLLEASQGTAMTTTYNEVDMSGIIELRSRRREGFKSRHGVDLGFMSFFVKAVVGALREFPQVNAELDGEELVYKYYYDIGIAVGSDEGLVVPVLRDADKKSFAEIEAGIGDMVQRTRERKLTLEQLTGGTFTITNGGVFGSLLSTPLLNPPQVGILGMHRIMERPIAVNGQVVVRSMMYLALTYDHRVVDGADAVRFLVRVKELVEDPSRLLLES